MTFVIFVYWPVSLSQFRQKCIGNLVDGLVRDVGKGLVCDVGVGSTHGTPVVINL